MRFIYRPSITEYRWSHEWHMQPGDIDCTEMNDEQFEAFVRSQPA